VESEVRIWDCKDGDEDRPHGELEEAGTRRALHQIAFEYGIYFGSIY
jgi:hypothetical protein